MWRRILIRAFLPVLLDMAFAGLRSIGEDIKREIDERKELKNKEKTHLKEGVELLLDRAVTELADRV